MKYLDWWFAPPIQNQFSAPLRAQQSINKWKSISLRERALTVGLRHTYIEIHTHSSIRQLHTQRPNSDGCGCGVIDLVAQPIIRNYTSFLRVRINVCILLLLFCILLATAFLHLFIFSAELQGTDEKDPKNWTVILKIRLVLGLAAASSAIWQLVISSDFDSLRINRLVALVLPTQLCIPSVASLSTYWLRADLRPKRWTSALSRRGPNKVSRYVRGCAVNYHHVKASARAQFHYFPIIAGVMRAVEVRRASVRLGSAYFT